MQEETLWELVVLKALGRIPLVGTLWVLSWFLCVSPLFAVERTR